MPVSQSLEQCQVGAKGKRTLRLELGLEVEVDGRQDTKYMEYCHVYTYTDTALFRYIISMLKILILTR